MSITEEEKTEIKKSIYRELIKKAELLIILVTIITTTINTILINKMTKEITRISHYVEEAK